MSNNRCIQILRGTSNFSIETCTEVLSDGQPFWNPVNGMMYIGDGVTELKNLNAVAPDYELRSLDADMVENIWNEYYKSTQEIK